MSVETLSDQFIKSARKDHDCSASWFLREFLSDIEDALTEEEKAAVERAKENGWKIKKGQPYIRQNNKMDGELYIFKAIPEIHDICIMHDLYDI